MKGPWERWSWKMGPRPHVNHTEDGVLLTDGLPPNQDVVIQKLMALSSRMAWMCSMGKTENGQTGCSVISRSWWKSLDSAQQKTESGLPNRWETKPRLHHVLDCPLAGILFSCQLLSKGHNSLCSRYCKGEFVCCVPKGREVSESEYTGSSFDNPWRRREMHGGHRAISKKLIILTRCLQRNLSASCWNWTRFQILKVSQCKHCLWGSKSECWDSISR